MAYTLWHRETLIGETDFEHENGESAPQVGGRCHLAGVFRPTPYGRRLLPRLCGILTAGMELKEELLRRGITADDVPPDTMAHVFETTDAGAHIIDIGRVLSEVELRDPGGVTLKVASMGFMDLAEVKSLSRKLGATETTDIDEVPSQVVEFLVSVTLRELAPRIGPSAMVQ
jgi:hypothetical protein